MNTWKLSSKLRWLKMERGMVLQQASVCIETGEMVWENVPIVIEALDAEQSREGE